MDNFRSSVTLMWTSTGSAIENMRNRLRNLERKAADARAREVSRSAALRTDDLFAET